MLPNLLYEATIILIPKLDKDTGKKKKERKKLQANISNVSGCKNPQIIIKKNSIIHRKYCIPQTWGIYSSNTRLVQQTQINQCDTTYQSRKRQKPNENLKGWRKIIWQISTFIHDLSEHETEITFPNIYDKSVGNIILNTGKNWKPFCSI